MRYSPPCEFADSRNSSIQRALSGPIAAPSNRNIRGMRGLSQILLLPLAPPGKFQLRKNPSP
ncbi:MAG: hypothetical protein JWQ43_1987 [Glaciihabitans sp.]|nr:hypothetical protein [Glaciihabitans sp.]